MTEFDAHFYGNIIFIGSKKEYTLGEILMAYLKKNVNDMFTVLRKRKCPLFKRKNLMRSLSTILAAAMAFTALSPSVIPIFAVDEQGSIASEKIHTELSVSDNFSELSADDVSASETFEIAIRVTNYSSETITNAEISTELPSGIALMKSNSVTDEIAKINSFQSVTIFKNARVVADCEDKTYEYKVSLTSGNGEDKEIINTISVPGTKKTEAFDYTVFSAAEDSDISLSCWKSSISGNVYSGKNFVFNGSELYLKGNADTVGNVTTNGWIMQIDKRNEKSAAVAMPDFGNAINKKATGAKQYSGRTAFTTDRIDITDSIRTDDAFVFGGTSFAGNGCIIAKNSIEYNVNTLTSGGSDKVIMYSENGDITISGTEINFNGILYAPNGTVSINSNIFNLNGRIIADRINFNSNQINIVGGGNDFDFANSAPLKIAVDIPKYILPGEKYGLFIESTDDTRIAEYNVDFNGKDISVSSGGSFEISAPAIDGSYTLNAGVTDTDGNGVSVSYETKVDTKAPVIDISADRESAKTGEDPIVFEVSAADDNPIASLIAVLDGEITEITDGKVILDTTDIGTHSLQIHACDECGNISTFEKSVYIRGKDEIPPAVTVEMPENAEYGSSVTVSVLCEDESGIAEIKAALDGESVSLDDNNEYTFTADKLGKHTFSVSVTDKSGNKSEVVREITVADTTNPEISVSYDKEAYAAGDDMVITVKVIDDFPVESLSVKFDGTEIEKSDDGKYVIEKITAGAHTVTVTAVDANGNEEKYEKKLDELVSGGIGRIYKTEEDFNEGNYENAWYNGTGAALSDVPVTGKKTQYAYDSLVYAISDIVLFAYEDTCTLNVSGTDGTFIGAYSLNKGQHEIIKVEKGFYKIESTKEFSALTGDPISGGVMGYYALDGKNKGLSKEFYTYVTPRDEYIRSDLILFSYTDNTTAVIEDSQTGEVLWSGVLNKFDHYCEENAAKKWVHITADNPIAALTCSDESYYVPSSNGTMCGKEFCTYVPREMTWDYEFTVTSYCDNNHITVTNTETGGEMWSGVLNSGETHTICCVGKYVKVICSENASVHTFSWEIAIHCPYPFNGVYMGAAVGTYASDINGKGIGKEFITPIRQRGYTYILPYYDGTVVDVYDMTRNTVIGQYTLSAGECIDVNSSDGLRRITSNKDIAVYTGMENANGGFAGVRSLDVETPENGRWETVFDSGEENTKWGNIRWNADIYNNGSIDVFVSSSNDGTSYSEPIAVENGKSFDIPDGRYIKVTAEFVRSGDGFCPCLKELEIGSKDYAVSAAEEAVPTAEIVCPNEIYADTPITVNAKTSGFNNAVCKWKCTGGNAAIENANAFSADITFTAAGEYTVKLSVTDGKNTVTKDVSVIVKSFSDMPRVKIISERNTIGIGEELKVTVVPENMNNGKTALKVNGTKVILDENNSFSVSSDKTGQILLEASAESADGKKTACRKIISVKQNAQAPKLTVESIPESITVGQSVEIKATVEDTNADAYIYVSVGNEQLPFENGTAVFTPDAIGKYEIVVSATDTNGNTISQTFSINVIEKSDVEDVTPPTFTLSEIPETITVGEEFKLTITAEDDSGSVNISAKVNGESTELTDNVLCFTPDKEGEYTLEIDITDPSGNGGVQTIKLHAVKAANPEDDLTPEVKIASPIDGAVITAPTEIIGTVTPDGLVRYTLEYAPSGTENYVLIAEGTQAVDNDVLGKLDTTMLKNGIYDIRLTGYGVNLNKTIEATVSVEGQMKIGNYSVAFNDMDIDAAGVPLTVVRGYDSRDRMTSGDFGYGWKLSFGSVSVSESVVPGMYWSSEGTGEYLIRYSAVEKRPHYVTVDLGNGKTEKFRFVPVYKAAFAPTITDVSASFVNESGTKSKLEAVGASSGMTLLDGQIMFTSGNVFNPDAYRYTAANGTVYIISQTNGLLSVTDTNGNVITVTKDGITHSDGKSIAFIRDDENRITSITNSTGKSVQYGYDENGNLIYVTAVNGDTVTFGYNENHFLTDITDPRGVKAARNEYDDDGRLIAVTDANGNRMEFRHDIDGRRETVCDRLGNATLYIYDENGNVLSQTDPLGNETTYTYDSNGFAKTKTDVLGNITAYSYDANGNLLSMTDAAGNTVSNTYNERGLLTSISALDVIQLIVNYDEYGNLSSTTDAASNAIEYTYNRNGKVTSISDSIGDYLKVTYDGSGNVITAVNGENETAEFTYDADENCTSKTVTRGSERLTEQYSYDDAGNLTKVIYADGTIISTEFNSIGKISAAVDPKGRRTSYEYDLTGNLIKITYCDNSTESFEYDAKDRNTGAVDRLGRRISMTYDAVGNLLSKTYTNGASESYRYDGKYRLIGITDVNGGTTSYEYDTLDRNTAITDTYGNRTVFGYGSNGQLSSMTDAKGNTIRYGYDANGNRTSVTMPDGTSISAVYDARGRITAQTDQYGRTTRYGYDGADRLTSVTDALGGKWVYGYDSVGELISVTDAMNNTTRYSYDSCGRVIETTNAAGARASITYDEAGNVLTSTDFAGNTTYYTYDGLDRVIRKSVGGEMTSYAYTTDGLLSEVTDSNGTPSYTYDMMIGLTSVTLPDGNVISYTYDSACRLTGVKTAFGETEYGYDKLDRLVRVIAHDGTATLYEYDANGNRTAVKYANGITVTYEYDEENRLVKEKVLDKDGGAVAQYGYTLGLAGERLKVEELDKTVEYEYDALYRLTKETVTAADGTLSETVYTYDRNSNRLTKTENGVVTEYSYNSLNQLVSETGIAYSYDLNGSLIAKIEADKNTTYTYNAQNRLIRVKVNDGLNVGVEEYRYDYAGNRIAKITELGVTNYLVDTNGALSQVLAETGTENVVYTRGAVLISQERGGVKSYYLFDGHDSVRMLTNADGIVTDTYTFDAFGNLTASTGNTENSYLYCGEQFDSFTGLYYLRARYMNPSTGTFITMDEYAGSVFEPVSLHKYLYANANPVMYCDPSGYATLGEQMVAGAVMGATANLTITCILNILGNLDKTGEAKITLTTNDMIVSVIVGGVFGAVGAYYYAQCITAVILLSAYNCGYCAGTASVNYFNRNYWQGTGYFILSIFGVVATNQLVQQSNSLKVVDSAAQTKETAQSVPQKKFGDNDLVLGLNENGSLGDFKANGGKGYGEFSSDSNTFSGQIKDAMIQSDTIRFNLDGVDLNKINSYSGTLTYAGDVGTAQGEPIYGYTNYELWLIKTTPDYMLKTVFYENGVVKPIPPELK